MVTDIAEHQLQRCHPYEESVSEMIIQLVKNEWLSLQYQF